MIDFHLSYRSSAFLDGLAAQSPRNYSVAEALARLAQRHRPSAIAERHLADWLGTLDTHGVTQAVAHAGCEREIPLLAEAAHRSQARLVPFAPLDPSSEDAAERVEHLLSSSGFSGVILNPGRDGYLMSETRIANVLEAIDNHGGIAMVECGLPDRTLERAFGLHANYDPNAANPLHLLVAADQHPNLTLVVPHFGGGFLRELLLVASQCPNIHVDTSSENEWMRAQTIRVSMIDVFEQCLAIFGPHRILFGTGSTSPQAGWKQSILTKQREALGACGLSPEDCELVFDGNARRLLGLPIPNRSAVPQTH